MKVCLSLIREGINARIRGGNLGEQFRRILESFIDQPGFSYSFLDQAANIWATARAAEMEEAGKTALEIETVWDMAQTLVYLWKELNAPTIFALILEIQELFNEARGADIWLSTIHRAKGLEADRVFIIRPELLPHPLAKGAAEHQQERNLKFVALTRAKKHLFFASES